MVDNTILVRECMRLCKLSDLLVAVSLGSYSPSKEEINELVMLCAKAGRVADMQKVAEIFRNNKTLTQPEVDEVVRVLKRRVFLCDGMAVT
jgi:hypothetical protein